MSRGIGNDTHTSIKDADQVHKKCLSNGQLMVSERTILLCINTCGDIVGNMKKIIPLIMFASVSALASPVKADLTSRFTSSVQLQVNAAATQMQRVGNSYSISGTNVDTTDGTTANTISGGTIANGIYGPGTISATQDDPGEAFSFSTAFTQGDALVTSAPSVGAVSALSNQLSTGAGTAGNLAGTVNSQGALTVTAGGAGTIATGQFVTELQID